MGIAYCIPTYNQFTIQGKCSSALIYGYCTIECARARQRERERERSGNVLIMNYRLRFISGYTKMHGYIVIAFKLMTKTKKNKSTNQQLACRCCRCRCCVLKRLILIFIMRIIIYLFNSSSNSKSPR